MSKKYKDLTGMKFGYLTVIKRIEDHIEPSGRKVAVWECICDCGNIKNVRVNDLKYGKTQSCGCYQKERTSAARKIHGQSDRTRLYNIWGNMMQRCYNTNNKAYKYYGGRGITVCEEWHTPLIFIQWAIENGYKDNLEIERNNYNGDYSPDNCRWATRKEQNNNKSNNHLLTYNGKTQSIALWAEEKNINFHTLSKRISRGWDVERALNTPV